MVDESLHLDMDTCRWNDPLVNLDSWTLQSVRVKEGRRTVDVEQKDERSRREPDTGVGGGMDRGEGVKPQKPFLKREHEHIVCVGGLDTNDEEEVGEYYDGGMSSGYLDDRTGLELDEHLCFQAEAEEMAFM